MIGGSEAWLSHWDDPRDWKWFTQQSSSSFVSVMTLPLWASLEHVSFGLELDLKGCGWLLCSISSCFWILLRSILAVHLLRYDFTSLLHCFLLSKSGTEWGLFASFHCLKATRLFQQRYERVRLLWNQMVPCLEQCMANVLYILIKVLNTWVILTHKNDISSVALEYNMTSLHLSALDQSKELVGKVGIGFLLRWQISREQETGKWSEVFSRWQGLQ